MSGMQLDLNIIELADLDIDSPLALGNLFIRYYIHTGDGQRIMINTREVQCAKSTSWNEASSLKCRISSDMMKDVILAHNIVFELRWRKSSKPIFGNVAKSKVLGSTEVSWEDLLEFNERRISVVVNKSVNQGMKQPKLAVKAKITFTGSTLTKKDETRRNICRCKSCKPTLNDEDVFQAAMMINSY